MERRRLRVLIPYGLIEGIVRDGVRVWAVNGLPSDARLVAIDTDVSLGALIAVFEHETFPITKDGCLIQVPEPSVDWRFELRSVDP